jgi:hypothetical protein
VKRLFVVAALVALAASCVPASEEAPPAGAFGFVTEPSPASRHEPFVTSDGWTVRVEMLVLQVGVSANSTGGGNSRGSYGSSELYRFDTSKRVEMFARAIPAGPAAASINLNPSYIGAGTDDYDDRVGSDDVPREVSQRFRIAADASSNQSSYAGPSMLLVARADKGDRTIVIDLTFDFYATSMSESRFTGEVVGDALVNVPVVVSAEALFTDEISSATRFDDYAALDADGDGRLSPREIHTQTETQTQPGTQPRDAGPSRVSSRFYDKLRLRAGRLILAR